MSEEGPHNKGEIQEIFRKLKAANSSNRVCFDCGANNPTWASVTYGVFICIDCSAVHRGLGVHVSFVRSTQLDTNWTWGQLRAMQYGGNANAQNFFVQHNCAMADAQQKYHSRGAALYKEKLSQLVSKYNKIHGNKIVFEEKSHDHSHGGGKESDFFDEMQKGVEKISIDNGMRLGEIPNAKNNQPGEGPSVDGLISGGGSLSSSSSAPRKGFVGQRKPANKLGAKKAGLGAQKVKANFDEIEKEAEMLDQMRERAEEQAKVDKEKQAEDDERQRISMSLAYQDISKQQQKRADKLKTMDPKKAQQVERLGMGLGVRSGISHSMMSDMKVIEQENPTSARSAGGSSGSRSKFDNNDFFFDDYEIIDETPTVTGLEGLNLTTSSSSPPKHTWDFPSTPRDTSSVYSPPKPRSHREPTAGSSAADGDEAQKKFGKAKAISSDQFFGDRNDNAFEKQQNLSRFEGSTSISSADYFGDGRQRNQASSYSYQQSVDLDDVKESVRQGVTKVAGKLSTMANGMMSSLQEKYGY